MSFFDDVLGNKPKFEELTFVAKEPVSMKITEVKVYDKEYNVFFKILTKVLDGEHAGKVHSIFVAGKDFKSGAAELPITLKILISRLLKEEIKKVVIDAEAKHGSDDKEFLTGVVIEAFKENLPKLIGKNVDVTYGPVKEYRSKTGELKKSQFLTSISYSENQTSAVKISESLEF